MKTRSILLLVAVLFTSNILMAQQINSTEPKVDIKVTKKTDENGNIISYDSTYVKTWSSANISAEQLDSMLNQFNMGFNEFALPNNDFFKDDFFSAIPDFKSIEEMHKKMIETMQEMFVSPKCNKIVVPKQKKQQKKNKQDVNYTYDEFM